MPDPLSASVAVEPDRSAVATSEPAKRPASRIRLAVLYCILVFAFSWSFWIYGSFVDNARLHFEAGLYHFSFSKRWGFEMLGGTSPAIVAILLGTITSWRSFPNPWSQIRSPIRPRALYLFSIFAPFLIFLLSTFVLEHLSSLSPSFLGFTNLLTFLWLCLTNLPLAPLWEEPGWRGCLLPLLAPRFGFWGASLVVGVIWAAWHFPMYMLLEGSSLRHYLTFSVGVVGMSVVMAALYKAGGNSLRLPILFHASWNAMRAGVIPLHSNLADRMIDILAISLWLLAAFCWLWWSDKQTEAGNPANI